MKVKTSDELYEQDQRFQKAFFALGANLSEQDGNLLADLNNDFSNIHFYATIMTEQFEESEREKKLIKQELEDLKNKIKKIVGE